MVTIGYEAGDNSMEAVFGDLAVAESVVLVFDGLVNHPRDAGYFARRWSEVSNGTGAVGGFSELTIGRAVK